MRAQIVLGPLGGERVTDDMAWCPDHFIEAPSQSLPLFSLRHVRHPDLLLSGKNCHWSTRHLKSVTPCSRFIGIWFLSSQTLTVFLTCCCLYGFIVVIWLPDDLAFEYECWQQMHLTSGLPVTYQWKLESSRKTWQQHPGILRFLPTQVFLDVGCASRLSSSKGVWVCVRLCATVSVPYCLG